MKYTKLGKSDLTVSRVCMGCMGFGNAATGLHSWTVGEAETREIIKQQNDSISGGIIMEKITQTAGRDQLGDFAPDSWFSHLAIEVPGENGSNQWLEPVSDEDYSKLN